jgi:beta-mannosidase
VGTAFDDQSSTFIIPSSAGFEVVFCPGARSTTILTTERDSMLQLAQQGHVDNNKQATMMNRKRSHVARKNGARRGMRSDTGLAMLAVVIAVGVAALF